MNKIINLFKFFGIWVFIAFVTMVLVVTTPLGNLEYSNYLILFIIFGAPLISFFLIRVTDKGRKQLELQRLEEEKQRKIEEDRNRFLERERVVNAIELHHAALRRNLARSIERNDYGAIINDKTSESIDEFLNSIGIDEFAFSREEATALIHEIVQSKDSEIQSLGFDPEKIPVDPIEFEKWVARSLEFFGWQAEVTPSGGDQGIDVIARKPNISVGIQCKLYSSNIGNSAIQEAVAGKAFYGVDRVAVLTNSDFTKSAKDLGLMNGVLLLSHYDIPRLEHLLS